MSSESTSQFLHNFGYIFLSFSSSISIIFCNKYLYQYYQFNSGTLLMGLHFVFTSSFSYALSQAHVIFPQYKALENFKLKNLDWISASLLGLLLALSVVFNNLSLQFNTIGVYQLSKLVIMPTILGLSYLLYKETTSRQLLLSVVLIIIGLAITVTAEVKITTFGLFTCLLAILSTAVQQMLLQRRNKDLNVNPFQLLVYQSPIASLIVLACSPFLDGVDVIKNDWMRMTENSTYLFFVILSCFIAFYVNLGSFLVIGKLSAMTYQVVGHSKTIVIIYVGSLIFQTPLNWTQFFGVLIALGGTIYYSYIKMNESKQPASPTVEKVPETVLVEESATREEDEKV